MALACSPDVVIADRPTTALDVIVIRHRYLQLLSTCRRQLNLSILLVTHDLGIVAGLCDNVMVMYGGVLAECAPVDVIYNEPRRPYTQELLKAFPTRQTDQRLASIPGAPPRLNAPPPGCRFALPAGLLSAARPNSRRLRPRQQPPCQLLPGRDARRCRAFLMSEPLLKVEAAQTLCHRPQRWWRGASGPCRGWRELRIAAGEALAVVGERLQQIDAGIDAHGAGNGHRGQRAL